jgi:hypothetical protein
MFDADACSVHRSRKPRSRIPQIAYAIILLFSGFSAAFGATPLPRPRPADAPRDQLAKSTNPQSSQCQQRLAGFAQFKPLPPITGPGECIADDVVALDSVLLTDTHRAVLSSPAVLRCPMAETVAHWLRDDVAPVIATMGTSLAGIETLDSFVCRERNGAIGGKISEHGRANALDVRALKLTDGRTIVLTDEKVSKALREDLRQSACARFTTVLGNGADAFHESHVHLDLLQRSNNYTICQWDVLDVAESAARAKNKERGLADAATADIRDVPLPRPRPKSAVDASNSSQHRREISREAKRGSIFDMIFPLMK